MWRLLIFLATGHWPRGRVVTAAGKALTELSDRVDDLERRLRTALKKLHTLEGHYYADMDSDREGPSLEAAPNGTDARQLSAFPDDEYQRLAAQKRGSTL